MAGVNIFIEPDDEAYLAALVASGRFPDASAAVAQAIKYLRRAEGLRAEFEASLEEVRAEVESGGRVDGDALFATIQRRLASVRQAESEASPDADPQHPPTR